jgi:hypothetical protein
MLLEPSHVNQSTRSDNAGQRKLSKIMNQNEFYRTWKDSFGMLSIGRGPKSQVFYELEYFKTKEASMLEVISVTEEAYGYQTAVLMKRKNNF